MAEALSASMEGTERYRQRFGSLHPDHFRRLQQAWASSVGLGTYLGDADDATDACYAAAFRAAIEQGCNVFDTAVNYRCQRSERVLGRSLQQWMHEGRISRDELLLCTKGGYLPFDGEVPANPTRYITEAFINRGVAAYDDIIGGCHCIAPAYIDHCLSLSLANLRMRSIDIYYLHNPEQQLDELPRDRFMERMEAAFSLLEQRAQEGKIGCYGIATWHGLRISDKNKNYLPLQPLVEMAERIGGESHHFRAVQLPYNLAMPEASAFKNQTVDGIPCSAIEAAVQLGLSVMASASLLQSRLTTLPGSVADRIPGLASAAQRAIQFVRSTGGVATALVGMKSAAHVTENLAVARAEPMSAEQLGSLFDRTRRAA